MSEANHHKDEREAGPDTTNGAAKPRWVKPPPPPEAADWVITPTPPEISEYYRRTFNEKEFLAEMREAERTGGADIDALLAEIERRVNGRA